MIRTTIDLPRGLPNGIAAFPIRLCATPLARTGQVLMTLTSRRGGSEKSISINSEYMK